MTASAGAGYLHVVAGVLRDQAGRVLLGRRPDHAHQGGLWEFPGGKVEPGETAAQALARELHEELGITPLTLRPLIRVPHRYPRQAVLLDVWRVDAFSGTPQGREGQPLRWVALEDLPRISMPAANRPVANALRLPPYYLITPEPEQARSFLDDLEASLKSGLRLAQLRAHQLSAHIFRALAGDSLALCRIYGASLLLNADPQLVRELGADGVHLTSARLRELTERPLPPEQWLGASCHDAVELAIAARLGVDFAVLSPVMPTRSHPHARALGWERFQALVEPCPFPVYALGGLGPADLDQALGCGGQGVAGIRAFWRASAKTDFGVPAG